MTQWKVDPDAVKAIMVNVAADQGELGAALSEDGFQGVLDALVWGRDLTGCVSAAVNAVFTDQSANLQNIGNRINAGIIGVSNAAIAFQNSQEDMCDSFQAELLLSAETGDFTYFEDNGYQE